jgi:hypothetical protein
MDLPATRKPRPGKPKPKETKPAIRPKPKRPPRTKADGPGKRRRGGEEEVTADNVQKFGQEFEKKWHEDRKKLGEEKHREMEKLWFEGRRPRGKPESIEKLKRIVEEFPDSNRAGCAAFELGHHYIRNRGLNLNDRRKQAQKYWSMVEDRYQDTLCEYNAHAPAMSKLAVATWVYRYTDKGMARRMLKEVIEKHQGETDHLGQPLEVTARRVLDQLK